MGLPSLIAGAFVSDWLREAYVTSCALIETLRTSHVLCLSASLLYLTNLAETYRIPKHASVYGKRESNLRYFACWFRIERPPIWFVFPKCRFNLVAYALQPRQSERY